jgi:adenosylcobinamide-GDP ribazoletransferase
MFRRELNTIFIAIMFYTRIPVPGNTDYSDELLNRSTRYLTAIGLLVGGIGAGVFWGLYYILPFPVAVILAMASTIYVTSAFHEDGFADFCDGFGGGSTPERILEIMKDSRIGTYGATGLVLMLLTKFFCISNMNVVNIPVVLISAHAFSRLLPVCLIYTAQYARTDASSKTKPIGHKGGKGTFLVALVVGIAPLYFVPWKAILLMIFGLLVLFLLFHGYIKRKLGGYTGDVLGALQQLAEVTIYLMVLIYQHLTI